jgi:hypothetical protein
MSTSDVQTAAPIPASRDELIAMVARAHHDSAYGESTLAGRTLAAQSKLPKVIAENLGAGFGQWEFFPEAAEIVDFACAYVPPSTPEELWIMARTWASDEAAARPTLMNLVGREILQHELRRIDVPKLRELFEETRSTRTLALRASLGLDVPAAKAKAESRRRAPATAAAAAAAAGAAGTARRAAPAATEQKIPARMPKPIFVPPPKRTRAPARRFGHPKFGEGVLEREEGVGLDAKLTIKFDSGSKTLLARYVTEILAE